MVEGGVNLIELLALPESWDPLPRNSEVLVGAELAARLDGLSLSSADEQRLAQEDGNLIAVILPYSSHYSADSSSYLMTSVAIANDISRSLDKAGSTILIGAVPSFTFGIILDGDSVQFADPCYDVFYAPQLDRARTELSKKDGRQRSHSDTILELIDGIGEHNQYIHDLEILEEANEDTVTWAEASPRTRYIDPEITPREENGEAGSITVTCSRSANDPSSN